MMFWYGDHMSGWGYGLMALTSVLFWVLVIGGVVALVRYLGRSPGAAGSAHRPAPEQVLAERFARGEIDAEEYRHRLDTLRAGSHDIVSP